MGTDRKVRHAFARGTPDQKNGLMASTACRVVSKNAIGSSIFNATSGRGTESRWRMKRLRKKFEDYNHKRSGGGSDPTIH